MFRRAARFALLFTLVLGMGAHLAVFQMAAWVNMMANYAQARPLLEAVVMTFDGGHPCQLCQAVSKARNEERRSPEKAAEHEKKPVFIWEGEVAVPLAGVTCILQKTAAPQVDFARGRKAPPIPPPKTEV